MVGRTYAEYKGEIYSWNNLLEKLNLDVDSNISGRVNFYKQASAKHLKIIRCMIKDDDGEYVEICNDCEELIEDCECNNNDNNEENEEIEKINEEKIDDDHFIPNSKLNNDKKYTKGKCGLYISDLEHSNIKINNKYVGIASLKVKDSYGVEIKYKDLSSILKNNNGNLKIEGTKNCDTITYEICITEQMYKESKGFHINLKEKRIIQEKEKIEKETQEKLEQEKSRNEQIKEKNRQDTLQKISQNNLYTPNPGTFPNPYVTYNKYGHVNGNGNGNKKITTRAKLPSGEMIQWTELLRRYNLPHRDGSAASVEWITYKNNDTKNLLPNVEVVDLNGNIIPDKVQRKVISRSDHDLNWIRYFGKEEQGLCPCCVGVRNITIHKSWFIDGHNIPHSKGGTEDLENLVPICKLCNDGMSDKYTIAEYRERMLKPKIV